MSHVAPSFDYSALFRSLQLKALEPLKGEQTRLMMKYCDNKERSVLGRLEQFRYISKKRYTV